MKKNQLIALSIIILLIGLLGYLAYTKVFSETDNKAPINQQTNLVTDVDKQKPSLADLTNNDTTPIITGYDRYDNSDQKVTTTGKSIDYDDLTNQTNDKFSSSVSALFFAYENKNPDIVYFGATETRYENLVPINRVLKYDVTNQSLIEIFSQEAEAHDTETSKTLESIATQGNKLILAETISDYSPGICFSVWLNESEENNKVFELFYLDLDNPANGLKPYAVPEWKYNAEKEIQKQCEQEYGLSE